MMTIVDFIKQTNGQVIIRCAVNTNLYWIAEAFDMRSLIATSFNNDGQGGQTTPEHAIRVLLDKLDIWQVLVDENTKKDT